MRVYFLSDQTCGLYLGGVYLGLVDGFERSVELDPKAGILCELRPQRHLPLSFTIDESFLFQPPPQVSLYFTERGVAVYCHDFIYGDPALLPILQERSGDTLITLYRQGKVQVSVQNGRGFHILPLSDAFERSTIRTAGGEILLEGEGAFVLIGQDGELLLSSEGKVLEWGETLTAEIPFHDSLGHTAVCSWKGGELLSCAIRSVREPTEATLALALFESALIGADCTPYLAPALAEKASSLKEFLGDFSSVVLTERQDRVGLAYERKPRVFDVRYFRVQTEEGKIVNILPD